jgi:hypothetical protein
MKKMPTLPSEERDAGGTGGTQAEVEQLIATGAFKSGGPPPRSALESTLHSHAKQLDTIRGGDPFMRTTSQVHGSRLPIEQVD